MELQKTLKKLSNPLEDTELMVYSSLEKLVKKLT